MHLVEVTIPSGMVSFGNVKPSIAVKDPTDLAEVAAAYLEACAAYKEAEKGYVAAKQAGIEADRAAPEPVVVPEEADDDVIDAAATLMAYNNDGPDDVEAAAAALTSGLGGATLVDDEVAPWEKEPEAPTTNPWDEEPVPAAFTWNLGS